MPRSAARSDLCKITFCLQPVLAIAGALAGKQHVHDAVGLVTCIERQLHQTAGIGVDCRFAQLLGVHFTQSLEALNGHLATNVM